MKGDWGKERAALSASGGAAREEGRRNLCGDQS